MQAATIDASADDRHPQPPITVFDDAGPLDADAAAIAAEAADDVSALPDTAARSGSSSDAAAKIKGATAAPTPAAPMVNNAPSSKHKHRRKMIPLKRVRQCCWAPVMCILASNAHIPLGCCRLASNCSCRMHDIIAAEGQFMAVVGLRLQLHQEEHQKCMQLCPSHVCGLLAPKHFCHNSSAELGWYPVIQAV